MEIQFGWVKCVGIKTLQCVGIHTPQLVTVLVTGKKNLKIVKMQYTQKTPHFYFNSCGHECEYLHNIEIFVNSQSHDLPIRNAHDTHTV